MRKRLLIVLVLSALGLAGCVAVPAYEAPYYAPAPVVVQPTVRFGYYGGPYYGHRHHHRHHRH